MYKKVSDAAELNVLQQKERPGAPARRAGVSANDIVYYIAAQQYVRPTYRHLYCAIRVTQKNVPNSAILARGISGSDWVGSGRVVYYINGYRFYWICITLGTNAFSGCCSNY